MCEIDKLVNELSSHYPEIKSNIETKISIIAIQLGKKKFDELFLGNHQETQDCTKLFQFVVNSAIEELCREKNIPLYQKEVDGADWVWVDKDGNEILLEQKVRTFLGRSKNFYKNIKGYGLPCTSWTGNKSSVYNKKKVDYHLLWSFEIIGNKIGRGGGEVLSLSENGAELAFTYLGDALKKRVVPLAESLKSNFTLSCDVEKKEDIVRSFDDIKKKWGNLDFVVHAIAFSDRAELSGEYLNTSRENFLKSMLISCFSLTEIAKEASKIMNKGSSMLTLTYESSKVIPNYNVMGVCKAALETSVKYLARDLGSKGIRVNAISAGPIKTLAASAIGDAKFLYKWNEDHSLLKRNVDINDVGGSALYLLSDLSAAVTGEIHYVDAGYNKVGMPNPKNIT